MCTNSGIINNMSNSTKSSSELPIIVMDNNSPLAKALRNNKRVHNLLQQIMIEREMTPFIMKNAKLAGIKRLRDISGLDLKECKDKYEILRNAYIKHIPKTIFSEFNHIRKLRELRDNIILQRTNMRIDSAYTNDDHRLFELLKSNIKIDTYNEIITHLENFQTIIK